MGAMKMLLLWGSSFSNNKNTQVLEFLLAVESLLHVKIQQKHIPERIFNILSFSMNSIFLMNTK